MHAVYVCLLETLLIHVLLGSCAAGHGGTDQCTICPKRTYKAEPGPGECGNCDQGTTTDGEGKTKYEDFSKFIKVYLHQQYRFLIQYISTL